MDFLSFGLDLRRPFTSIKARISLSKQTQSQKEPPTGANSHRKPHQIRKQAPQIHPHRPPSPRPPTIPVLCHLVPGVQLGAQPPDDPQLEHFLRRQGRRQQQPGQQKVEERVTYAGKCFRNGMAVDVDRAAFRPSLNVLSNTIFSVDLVDPSEDTVQEFRDLVWSLMVDAGKPNLVDYLPAAAGDGVLWESA
ncbi:hypothetical protein Acr_00g0009480 [Actinidia rufa]|uniref:Uncharacterized protein n=1 Tax=Actinidia rufa TaxID=165716 RepID=A0A7J0D941_9ERIC|nr:hypothetical protein Acr_00g0009480 [Actinidia rufa]